MENVHVHIKDHAYDIAIGSDLIENIRNYLNANKPGKDFFVISDEQTFSLYGSAFIKDIGACAHYTVSSGEGSKSIDQYSQLLNWLAENGAKRDSIIIALGGGVVGDLTGFVAASYMRGVDFVQYPTTLLAQVDSSVGGKTAINIPAGKNLVGAFHQPIAVFCDSETLKTLPEREMRAGYAEIYKYGLLWDKDFLSWLNANGTKVLNHDAEALQYAVKRCCEIKAEIVSQDEKEQGVRALLNLGHTFGHALEALCEYDDRLRHGEAVSIGMCMAAVLSQKLGYISADEVASIKNHLSSAGLPVHPDEITNKPEITVQAMLSVMAKDKKATSEGLKFIVMKSLGNAVTEKVPLSYIEQTLNEFI